MQDNGLPGRMLLSRRIYRTGFAERSRVIHSQATMPGSILTVVEIGDSLTSEIQGGVDYGLDIVWNNLILQKSRKSFRTLILFFY